jgi:hypothetical protein
MRSFKLLFAVLDRAGWSARHSPAVEPKVNDISTHLKKRHDRYNTTTYYTQSNRDMSVYVQESSMHNAIFTGCITSDARFANALFPRQLKHAPSRVPCTRPPT